MSRKETLIAWLNDAYATEQNLIKVLENHVEDAAAHPELQARLESHLAETRHHADLVNQCVEQLGGSTSGAKAMVGKIAGFFQGISTGMSDDELVKNCLADYSMEHFEIASYKSLIAGAEAMGETQIAETCKRILRDEEEMARWLDNHLTSVVQDYIMHEQAE